MLNRKYRDVRFNSEAEFVAVHKERASQGDEVSKSILNTRSRILLGELARIQKERENKD